MNFRLVLLGIVALALVLAACAPPPELRDEALLDDISLISGQPCCPLLARHYTGETLWRDAITILEDDPDFDNIQTSEDEASDAIGAIWRVAGGPECCQMVAEDGETVNLVFLRTRPDMTLDEVIDEHGEPTYVVGTPVTDDQAIVNVVYPETPMIVLAFAPGPSGDVTASSEIVGMFYTTLDDMELFLSTQYLHTWEGYTSFATYQMAEDSDYEVTPSVTVTPTVAAE